MSRRGRISNRTPARFLRQELTSTSCYIYKLDEKGQLTRGSNGTYDRELCTYDANVPAALEPAHQEAVENVQSPSTYVNEPVFIINIHDPNRNVIENEAPEISTTEYDFGTEFSEETQPLASGFIENEAQEISTTEYDFGTEFGEETQPFSFGFFENDFDLSSF